MVQTPPRRATVIDLLGSYPRALHLGEITSRLGIDLAEHEALGRVLDDLVMDGTVTAMPGHRYKLSARERVQSRSGGRFVEGYLSAHARGFGFVATVGDADDIFVPAESMGGAMHGDRVRARIVARSHRGTEGAVEEVLERRPPRVAGTLRKRGKSSWVEPDDERIRGPIVLRTAKAGQVEGDDGDVVVVLIERFPDRLEENPEGSLVEVLGRPGEPSVEVRKILTLHAVTEAHPADAVAESEAFGGEVDPAALEGREDFSAIPLPTIDPEDARDHDDALWAVRNDDGSYRAWVAIADVSHYVAGGTAVDRSALERGCSIYLPDRAIPMLPRALSTTLCSLLPDVTRLCVCIEIDLDATGEPVKHRIALGQMRSAAKLSYENVARTLGLSTEATHSPAADALAEGLGVLRDLAALLRAKRMRRGALDLDLPEAKIIVDPETGRPLDAKRRAKDPGVAKTYHIVEELMLLANETVARFLVERNVPTIYRVHAAPTEEKIARFGALCELFGVAFEPEDAGDPKKLSALVKKLRAHPQRAVLDSLLVRSLKQAAYDTANVGHFGLASPAYLHFTSPIRRYPDLVVHRAVKALVRGQRVDRSDPAMEALRLAASTASERERRAMTVEREVADAYRAYLMKDRIGERFAGTVSSIVGSGVFVTLEDPFVDVLVKSEALGPDAYEPDEFGLAMVAARSGDRIQLGDPMLVQIEDVALLRRTVYARRIAGAEGEGVDGDAKPRRAKLRSGATVPAATGGAGHRAGAAPGGRGKGAKGERGRATRREEPAKTKKKADKRASTKSKKATKSGGKKRR
jgi:ribonuclease R